MPKLKTEAIEELSLEINIEEPFIEKDFYIVYILTLH